ncbi:hypothetical protein HYW54_04705 [Candidatus Gottesmanbacteria bacterium]|nr:hypothetical protein [Candidatus Gottesmanbacteria bacterium]
MNPAPTETPSTSQTPPSPPLPNIPSPPLSSSKKIFIFIGVTIIFLLSVSGAYFLGKSQSNSTTSNISPSPILSLSPTPHFKASWKTFTNTKYGYQFQYPSNWDIWSVDGSGDYPPGTPTPPATLGKSLLFGYTKRGIGTSGDEKQIQLDVHALENPQQLPLKEYFVKEKWGEEWLKLMEDTTVNNLEAVNLKFSGSPSGYYINIGKYIINLAFSATETNEKFEIPPQQVFDQILSTFKFL